MRVIECNECGETLSAANDDELARELSAHLQDEHDIHSEDAEVADLLHEEAYDAADS
jgi:predicted small metal-binding protein